MSLHSWQDYRVEFLDKDRTILAVVRDAVNMKWSLGLWGEGRCSFSVHRLSQAATYVLSNKLIFVVIYRCGVKRWEGFVVKEKRAYEDKTQGREEYIEVEAVHLTQMLKWRHILGASPGDDVSYTGFVDDVFKEAVTDCFCAGAPTVPGSATSRVLAGFTVEADESACPTTDTFKVSRMNLYHFLYNWGIKHSVDFAVEFDASWNFEFKTWYPRRGADKTIDNGVRAPMLFNDATPKALRGAAAWRDSADHANALISVTGETAAEDAAAQADWLLREALKENDDEEIGVALEQLKVAEGYEYKVKEFEGQEAFVDFVPGDTVTYGNNTLSVAYADQIIRMIEVSVDQASGQETIDLTFGLPEPDILDDMKNGGGGPGAIGGEEPFMWGLEDTVAAIVWPGVEGRIQIASLSDALVVDAGLAGILNVYLDFDELAAVPTITFGSAFSEGIATTFIRTDAVFKLVFAGDSGTAVPDAANTVTVEGGAGITVTAAGDTVSVAMDAHDIVGSFHTVTASQYQIVGVTAANTLGLLTPSSNISAGNLIAISNASGQLTAAAFIASAGEYMDASSGVLRLYGDSAVSAFVGGTRVLRAGSAQVLIDGVDLALEAGLGITHEDATATLCNLVWNGTRFVPDDIQHRHGVVVCTGYPIASTPTAYETTILTSGTTLGDHKHGYGHYHTINEYTGYWPV